jgi:hypothetical protein
MTLPSTVTDLLDEGRAAVRGLVKFEFTTGTYGAWNGTGVLTYAGLDYHPNSLISVEDVPMGLGSDAVPLTIEMPESADFGITPDVLAGIETVGYKGAPVTIYDAYFEPDTRELLHVEALYSGYIDYIDHSNDGEGFKLVGHIETSALDNHRDGYRSASNADQQLVSAGDKFFEHAAKVQTETFKITLK